MKSSKILKFAFVASLLAGSLSAQVLTFSQAYDLALLNANRIKSSVYQADSNKESINQEKSRLYPQISFSSYYRRSEQELNVKNRSVQNDEIKQSLLSYAVSLRQSLYNAQTYSRIGIEQSRDELTQTKVELYKKELAQEVFTVYLDVLKSVNKIELFKSYLEYNKYKLQALTKKYEMNLSNKMDLLEVQVDYNSAQIDLDKETRLLKVSKLKLEKFIGQVEYELPIVESDKSIVENMTMMREFIADGSLVKNLEIKQAKIARQMAQKEIKNAYNEHMPTLDFDASYSMFDTDNPTSDSDYDNIQQYRVTLNIPIYTGGYVSSKVTAAELMSKASAEDLLDTQKEAKVRYDEYLALYDAASDSVTMYKGAIESAELYVEAIQQGYEHGLKSIIDLNDAKSKMYEVKYRYVENMYEMVDSYVGLLIVTNRFEAIELLDKLLID